ncbi:hypothetical protein [Pontibacter vulgaris]|uniref:hypothetical protein n=1 Tax=Pontibacter vulgaris TaxID=2905679 RepID=UPI001FA81076|nr:hypothetical protein [Pontibacter vulgaris]
MMINIASLAFLFTFVVYSLLVTFILTCIYFDAEQRGIKGWLVVFLTFFSGTIFGTIVWLLLRPKLKTVPVRAS